MKYDEILMVLSRTFTSAKEQGGGRKKVGPGNKVGPGDKVGTRNELQANATEYEVKYYSFLTQTGLSLKGCIVSQLKKSACGKPFQLYTVLGSTNTSTNSIHHSAPASRVNL